MRPFSFTVLFVLIALVLALGLQTAAEEEVPLIEAPLIFSRPLVAERISQAIRQEVEKGYGLRCQISLTFRNGEEEMNIRGAAAAPRPSLYRVVYTGPEQMVGSKVYWHAPLAAYYSEGKRLKINEEEPFPLHAALEVLLVPEAWDDERLTGELEFEEVSSDLLSVRLELDENVFAVVEVNRDNFLPRSLLIENHATQFLQLVSGIRYLPVSPDNVRHAELSEFREAYSKSLQLMEAGEYEKAVPLLRRMVSIDPYNIRAHANLGYCYAELGDEVTAIGEFEQMLMLEPESALALNNLAYIYIDSELYVQKGLEMAERAVELEPDNSAFLDTLGWGYFKTGNVNRACRLLEEALALTEEDGASAAMIHFHLGMVYWQIGEEEMALMHLGKSVELDPSNEEAKRQLDLLSAVGDYSEESKR